MVKRQIVFLLILSTILLSGCYRAEDTFILNKDSFKDYSETEKFEDMRFPATSVKVQGTSNIPDFVILRNNTYTLSFSPTTMEQSFLTMQFPHNRITNSTIYPHFHWSTKEVGTGNVTWCVEYACANVHEILPFTKIECVTDEVEEPYKHQMTSMIPIENNFRESAMCGMRIFRDATNVLDNFPHDALLLEFDIHYLSYQLGEMNTYG